MHSYEVEVKSLLGSPEKAKEVRAALKKLDPNCTLVDQNTQLNHYFDGGTLERLVEIMRPHLGEDGREKLADMTKRARNFSVRTRDKDGTVILVVKASLGDDSSANGVSRMEFEETLPMSIDALDRLVLSAGFSYQAKWSREREEYLVDGVNVTLDKNAGYGWLAEFERVVNDASLLTQAQVDVRSLMDKLGIEELPQDRLERMFAFYNTHWPEYYGTEKIFTID